MWTAIILCAVTWPVAGVMAKLLFMIACGCAAANATKTGWLAVSGAILLALLSLLSILAAIVMGVWKAVAAINGG